MLTVLEQNCLEQAERCFAEAERYFSMMRNQTEYCKYYNFSSGKELQNAINEELATGKARGVKSVTLLASGYAMYLVVYTK